MKGLVNNVKDLDFYGNEFLGEPLLDFTFLEKAEFYIQSNEEQDGFLNIEFIEQGKSFSNAYIVKLSIIAKLLDNEGDFEAGSLIDGIVLASLIKNATNSKAEIKVLSKNILNLK